MSRKLVAPLGAISRDKRDVEHVGDCVVCKQGIFSDQEWGRAPKPLLGKAHTWCGGAK